VLSRPGRTRLRDTPSPPAQASAPARFRPRLRGVLAQTTGCGPRAAGPAKAATPAAAPIAPITPTLVRADLPPISNTLSEWEWANKEELWNAVVAAVWDDAVSRYVRRIHPVAGTVWPGADVSGDPVWAWSSHDENPRFGHIGLASVALTSQTPDQRRPDLAVCWYR
jgi:hypothetical protein